MTRRNFLVAAAGSAASSPPLAARTPLIVPVHRVTDRWAQATPAQFRRFWWEIWPQAVRDFSRGGIQLQWTDAAGEIRHSPGDRPIFLGLQRGAVNLVLTDHVPMHWDRGRALAGVTVLDEGYCVCLIALRYAHGHQIPFVSTNTCVHEMLHALLQDIFFKRPTALQVGERESRIDWYATRLWLFHDGAAIRQSAESCVRRLRPAVAGGF
jgi:hypothetical protein